MLTPPRRPYSIAPRPTDDIVRDAMNAALEGDFAAMERIEVLYLNFLVRLGELSICDAAGEPHWWFRDFDQRHIAAAARGLAPFVLAYHRRWGSEAEPAIEWALMPACRRCAGKLRRLECRVCEGRWYVDDQRDHELVYTSVEGLVLAEEPA